MLANDVDAVLHKEPFARYILKDEATGHTYPNTSGILYVSLTQLSNEKSPTGELASFLLGKQLDPDNGDVRKIAEAIKTSFMAFKEDKEVAKVLTLAERYTQEGEAIGEAKGEAKGKEIGVNFAADKIMELINKGFSLDEALRKIKEDKAWLNSI